MGAGLKVAPDLILPVEAVTETFGLLAMRGAGKTNAGRVMAEEFHAAGAPFVVVDPVGSWYGLRAGRKAGEAGLPVPIFGGKYGDVPLERGGGNVVADLVVDQRVSCVLDLSTFESEAAKKGFLLDFARRLYLRNEQPLHLFLEEADDYIPQRPMRDEAHLLRAWENIVRRGRARGLGITLITQRSASISKSVLTQVGTLIAMRTTSPHDRAAIQEWVRYHGVKEELLASLSSLANGEAWVWSPQFLGVTQRVQFRPSRTMDSGRTPKLGDARPTSTLADVDLGKIRQQMAETIERAKLEDPRALRAEVVRLQGLLDQQPTPEAVTVEVPVLDPDLVSRVELVLGVMERRLDEARAELAAVRGEVAAAVVAAGKAPEKPAALVVKRAVETVRGTPARRSPLRAPAAAPTEAPVSGVQDRVLSALAELEQLGSTAPRRPLVAFLAGYTNLGSKGFRNALSSLSTAGLVEYGSDSEVSLTEAGRQRAVYPPAPRSPREVQERVISLLGGASGRILQPLIDAYPRAAERQAVAEAAGYGNLGSKGFRNALSRLSSLGFISYPGPRQVIASPVLFLEGGS